MRQACPSLRQRRALVVSLNGALSPAVSRVFLADCISDAPDDGGGGAAADDDSSNEADDDGDAADFLDRILQRSQTH